jgi:hypothetical protein
MGPVHVDREDPLAAPGWAIRRAAWMTQVMSPQVTNQLALSAFIEPDPERLFTRFEPLG